MYDSDVITPTQCIHVHVLLSRGLGTRLVSCLPVFLPALRIGEREGEEEEGGREEGRGEGGRKGGGRKEGRRRKEGGRECMYSCLMLTCVPSCS